MKASWVASRASARSPVIRYAREKIRSSCRVISSAKEVWLPSRKLFSNSSSLRLAAMELDLGDGGRPRSGLAQVGDPNQPVPRLCRIEGQLEAGRSAASVCH